jgi:AP-1 complex subunit gamma-1
MKLTASPHFPEKRIGYLGMMLLLSEEADVLMLATNALKNDLNSENKFVAGLALCCIGNLATSDMSRDLAPEVDKHLKSPLAYLRKKACLAMARCLTKCPDMVEDFVDRIATLLKDKTHGVLITVVQLATTVLMIDYRYAEQEGEDPFQTPSRTAFLKLVPTLVKMLRNLTSSGYSPDHDVGGISDPFLQVQLLTLLRLLGANNAQASEEMNDVLAQVATNTDSSKNAGNAILYECVQTIMGTVSEDGLRVLAVNILGRFLLNRDNNIRYVALNTISRCIEEQKHASTDEELVVAATSTESANNATTALQRHRQTVVDCLKDPDVSIRQRALELVYHLVNENNVESLTAELLNYLVVCPKEHRSDICTRILKVVDRFSPDDRWRVDTLLTTLTVSGREASRNVQNATVVYISRSNEDIHAFATHKLLKAVRDDDGTQYGLLSVGVWCIGEYGDLLLRPYTYTPVPTGGHATGGTDDWTNVTSTTTVDACVPITFMALEPMAVVDTLDRVFKRHSCPDNIKERILTAYLKLSSRFANTGDVAVLNKLHQLIQKNQGSRLLELQLRSCEYDAIVSATKGIAPTIKKPAKTSNLEEDILFGVSSNTEEDGRPVSESVMTAAKEALSRMPIVDAKVLQKRLSTDEFADKDMIPRVPRAAPSAAAASSGGDLLDIFGGETTLAPAANGVKAGPDSGKSDLDLLSDIFSAQASTTVVPSAVSANDIFGAPTTTAPVPVNPLDLFGAPPPTIAPVPAATSTMDLFGATPTVSQPSNATSQSTMVDLFGASSPAPSVPPSTGGPRVPALNHAGLSIEFECTKPDSLNQQKSVLIAHFQNSTNAPIHGMNLQIAVPKYVKMEMEPPTSTTIPPGMGNAKAVTQRVTVTNSMLGQKNLVLKLKIGFTSNGQKIEHMGTCSGFPAGQY